MSQDQEKVLNHLSDLRRDLSAFHGGKKPSRLEGVLTQLNQTLNQTRKVSGPARLSHYKGLLTSGALESLNAYHTFITHHHPGTRKVQAELDALNLRPDPVPFHVLSQQAIQRLLGKLDQVQVVETYVSNQAWDGFIEILRNAGASYKDLGIAIWEGAKQREEAKFDSVGGFLNWFTFGIPQGIYETSRSYYQEMVERPSFYTVTNYLTLGIPDTVIGAFNPEDPLSAQHLLDMVGVIGLVYGGAKAIKSVRGVATIKPITKLTTPVKVKSAGKPTVRMPKQVGSKSGVTIRNRVLGNIKASQQARKASRYGQYLKNERAVLNRVKENSGARFNRLDDKGNAVPNFNKATIDPRKLTDYAILIIQLEGIKQKYLRVL